MRSRNNLWIVALASCSIASGTGFTFHVMGEGAGSWPAILSSVGLVEGPLGGAGIVVAPQGTKDDPAEWTARVEKGTILILESDSPLAGAFGFKPTEKRNVMAQSAEDMHAPKLRIVWEKPLELPIFEMPKEARLFVRERWLGAPLMAGFRRGAGAVLWVAAAPGPQGYERFPYLVRRSRIWVLSRRSVRSDCGHSSILRIDRASIWITSRPAGARPASARCTWPRGITGNPIQKPTSICGT